MMHVFYVCTYDSQLILPINGISKPCQDVDLFVVSIVLVFIFPPSYPQKFHNANLCIYIQFTCLINS